MKKLFVGMISLVLMISLAACGGLSGDPTGALSDDGGAADRTTTSAQTTTTTAAPKKMTAAELDAAIAGQEVYVSSTKYLVQHEEYKSLYPDMLQAIIQNNSSLDIKNAVVAFVAWDANNLPVKIEGKYDFGNTAYVKQCNFSDINLVPGKSFGSDSGMALSSDMSGIKKIKAIVVSYESFDGDQWENPLYETWVEMYEGKRYSE